MAEASIPVDLLNPGQVFACLGFLEAADVLLSDAEGGFDWTHGADARFLLRAAGEENPFAAVLEFLVGAKVKWLSHDEKVQERDGGTTIVHAGISSSRNPKPPDLPAILVGKHQGREFTIHFGYWADGSTRFSTTFKKSTYKNSSHIRFKNAIDGIHNLGERHKVVADPFSKSVATGSLFRIDPRGYVDPIHAGTSPDKLRKGSIAMRVATYPACEALAVIGLEHTRPIADGPTRFSYYVWDSPRPNKDHKPVLLPTVLARAVLGGSFSFFRSRRFTVDHQEVKRGGDRKIITVIEESQT